MHRESGSLERTVVVVEPGESLCIFYGQEAHWIMLMGNCDLFVVDESTQFALSPINLCSFEITNQSPLSLKCRKLIHYLKN